MSEFKSLVDLAPAISAIVASLAFALAVVTAVRAYSECVHQNALKRFEKFQEMRKLFVQSNAIQNICGLLEDGDAQLRTIDYKDKEEFLRLYEQVALMHNSKLLTDEVAHYMFGYYAICCYESRDFWHGINRDGYYWSLFIDFAKRMKRMETR